VARKAERRDRITREDMERVERDRAEKEQKKAEIDAELQALIAKKAELEKPTEPKTEPVEETAASSGWSDFIAPHGWHLEGKYLVQDDEVPDANNPLDSRLAAHTVC
jgi:predicted phage gp36 major capsid-like protein